jgi:hypothetical protein
VLRTFKIASAILYILGILLMIGACTAVIGNPSNVAAREWQEVMLVGATLTLFSLPGTIDLLQ